jgi:hypothetical protein
VSIIDILSDTFESTRLQSVPRIQSTLDIGVSLFIFCVQLQLFCFKNTPLICNSKAATERYFL